MRALQGALVSDVLPGISGAVGVAQGISAFHDLQQHPDGDLHRRVSDYFQVGEGVAGAVALGALAAVVVVGAGAEIVATATVVGTVLAVGAAVAYLPIY